MSLLDVQDLVVRLGGDDIVRGVSFALEEGEVLALLGPSGCGKTTTLRTIAGLQKAASGEVRLGGRSLIGVPPERRGLGLVFQDGAVFPHLSVSRNLGFGLRPCDPARVDELLFALGLHGLGERMPHQLSGGQRQRVALGRALAPRPPILLLDEPFSSLDAALRVDLRAELFAVLRAARTAAILVTHDQDEALEVADVVAVMRSGALEQMGSPAELLEKPLTPFVAEFVGGAVVVPIHVKGGEAEFEGLLVEVDRPDGRWGLVLGPGDLTVGDGPAASVVGRRVRGGKTFTRVRLGPVAVEVEGTHVGSVHIGARGPLRTVSLDRADPGDAARERET